MDATALIAEDEPLLAAELEQALKVAWPELRVVARAEHGAAAVELALRTRPDVLFLDIRMPGLSGFEAAQAIAEDWPDDAGAPLIVFVTAYDQHALQAFEHAAVDYVLKPVDAARLARTVARLKTLLGERRGANGPSWEAALARWRELLASDALGGVQRAATPRLDVIQAASGNAIHLVPVREVVYFEAADKYVRVLTADAEHLIRLSLRELLPQLDPQRFWQIHRGTVVRSDAIARAERDEAGKVTLVLRGRPERLVVSRLHAHRFKPM
ncbi:MAG TPA: LytTR family DNA-binding domain-containing protein [Caldimonas sp.]|nr:LytTR family DNA-binding domain-containing protein [Caldimonas sp.]